MVIVAVGTAVLVGTALDAGTAVVVGTTVDPGTVVGAGTVVDVRTAVGVTHGLGLQGACALSLADRATASEVAALMPPVLMPTKARLARLTPSGIAIRRPKRRTVL
jgi:hypothetical protein